MPIQDDEIRQMMAEVQDSLSKALSSEHAKLSKALPGEESEEAPADDSAPDAGPAASAPADAAPPAPSAPAADASAAPPSDAPAEGSDPAADELDPEAIKAELAQMPIEHVKALYLASKEIVMAQMGGDGSEQAPPAPAPAPVASPSPAPDASPALKAELPAANGGDPAPVAKSQKDTEIEELKKRVSEFEGITSGLLAVVETSLKVPSRKAITSVTELAKSTGPNVNQLSKSEIQSRLDRAARTKLAKSDRELINQFTVGMINVDGIKHLLDVK